MPTASAQLERKLDAVLLSRTMIAVLRQAREAAQGWARHALSPTRKALLARALTSRPLALPLRAFARRIPCGECTVDTSFDFVTDRTRAEMLWGLYESAERRCVATSLARGHDIVELGASVGVVSSHLARRLAEGKRLVCVEASPELAVAIRKNVRTNAPSAQYVVESVAVAYGSTEVSFATSRDTTLGRVTSDSQGLRVPAASLSDLIAWHGLTSYVLVMDIEGAEAQILAHDREALSSCVQIIAELHPCLREDRALTQEDLAKEIEALGFDRSKQDGFVYVFDRHDAESRS
jgi:FkbM family methyltransferase